MLKRLSSHLRRARVALARLWRLGTSAVLGYRLRLRDQSITIGRVVDARVIDGHLAITDIDGLLYLAALDDVRSFTPIRTGASMVEIRVVGE